MAQLNIRTQSKIYDPNFRYDTHIEILDMDEECIKDIIHGNGFYIEEPQSIKKDLKNGYSFIYNNKKLGNIKEIPVNEFFEGNSKKIKTLYAPNFGKVKVTKKADEPEKKSDEPMKKTDEEAYKNLIKNIESKFEVVDIHIISNKNEYNFKLENVEKYKVYKLLEMLWQIQTIFNH